MRLTEIAEAEKINENLRRALTLLVPEIVKAILNGRQPADQQLEAGLRGSGISSANTAEAGTVSFLKIPSKGIRS